jgi:hypothetical protein
MSIQSQDVYAGPGMLISALSSGGTASPNVVVSTLVAANYVSTGQVRADGVETDNIFTQSLQLTDILNISTIFTSVTSANPSGGLNISVQGNCVMRTDSTMTIGSFGGSMALRSQSTLGLISLSSISLSADYDINIISENDMGIDSGGTLDISSVDQLSIDSGAAPLVINGRDWAQLVSTIDGLPR